MKNVAKTKEQAIKIAKNELSKYGKCFYEQISNGCSVQCGCGETNTIEIIQKINDNYHRCTVGYCYQCGTEFNDEVELSII